MKKKNVKFWLVIDFQIETKVLTELSSSSSSLLSSLLSAVVSSCFRLRVLLLLVSFGPKLKILSPPSATTSSCCLNSFFSAVFFARATCTIDRQTTETSANTMSNVFTKKKKKKKKRKIRHNKKHKLCNARGYWRRRSEFSSTPTANTVESRVLRTRGGPGQAFSFVSHALSLPFEKTKRHVQEFKKAKQQKQKARLIENNTRRGRK